MLYVKRIGVASPAQPSSCCSLLSSKEKRDVADQSDAENDTRDPGHCNVESPSWVKCHALFWRLPSDGIDLDRCSHNPRKGVGWVPGGGCVAVRPVIRWRRGKYHERDHFFGRNRCGRVFGAVRAVRGVRRQPWFAGGLRNTEQYTAQRPGWSDKARAFDSARRSSA